MVKTRMLPLTKPKVSENQLVEDFMRRLATQRLPCVIPVTPQMCPGEVQVTPKCLVVVDYSPPTMAIRLALM